MPSNLHDGLLGHMGLSNILSGHSDVKTMLWVENALAASLAHHDVISKKSARAIATALSRFEPDMQAIAKATIRDGVPVPELVRQVRLLLKDEAQSDFHFGVTSQDILDTSNSLRTKSCLAILSTDLAKCANSLEELQNRFGSGVLQGRTRMQRALPIKVSDKLVTWLKPVEAMLAKSSDAHYWTPLILGGAVGNLEAFGEKGPLVASILAEKLELHYPGSSLHTQRHFNVDLGNWLSQISGHLGKIGQDICLMAQNEIAEIRLSGGGGSSSLPHKQNPILAESLVTLARFNAVQISGLHQALVHENERSGSAWSLEWMILPNMVIATGAALRNAVQLLSLIKDIGTSQ